MLLYRSNFFVIIFCFLSVFSCSSLETNDTDFFKKKKLDQIFTKKCSTSSEGFCTVTSPHLTCTTYFANGYFTSAKCINTSSNNLFTCKSTDDFISCTLYENKKPICTSNFMNNDKLSSGCLEEQVEIGLRINFTDPEILRGECEFKNGKYACTFLTEYYSCRIEYIEDQIIFTDIPKNIICTENSINDTCVDNNTTCKPNTYSCTGNTRTIDCNFIQNTKNICSDKIDLSSKKYISKTCKKLEFDPSQSLSILSDQLLDSSDLDSNISCKINGNYLICSHKLSKDIACELSYIEGATNFEENYPDRIVCTNTPNNTTYSCSTKSTANNNAIINCSLFQEERNICSDTINPKTFVINTTNCTEEYLIENLGFNPHIDLFHSNK